MGWYQTETAAFEGGLEKGRTEGYTAATLAYERETASVLLGGAIIQAVLCSWCEDLDGKLAQMLGDRHKPHVRGWRAELERMALTLQDYSWTLGASGTVRFAEGYNDLHYARVVYIPRVERLKDGSTLEAPWWMAEIRQITRGEEGRCEHWGPCYGTSPIEAYRNAQARAFEALEQDILARTAEARTLGRPK